MPRISLTDASIRALKVPERGQVALWDASFRSFGIRCSYGGAKSFVLKKQNRWHLIGPYPVISLKQAREEARRRLALRYFPQHKPSQDAVNEYLALKRKQLRQSSFKHLIRVPSLPLPNNLSSILASDINTNTRNDYGVYKSFFNWCVERDYIDKSPLKKSPFKLKTRERVLSDEELKAVWQLSLKQGHFGQIVRLLILSGQRLNQWASLQKTWLQRDTIVFPATVMKSDRAFTLPLVSRVRTIIARMPNVPFTNLSTAMKNFRAELSLPHWTLHDLRRTFSTNCSRWQVCPVDITEAILDHSGGSRSQIQRTYDRYDRLEPMRRALTLYERKLLAVVA